MRKKNDAVETIEVKSRQEWRKWLNDNYDSQSEVWPVFRKRHTGVTSISYTDAVEEAICYGWISLVKKLDGDLYARKFTQRKADSKWSTINRRRYADLEARGLLAAPGLERAPTNRSGDAPPPIRVDDPTLYRKTIQGQSTCLAIFRRAGSLVSAGVYR